MGAPKVIVTQKKHHCPTCKDRGGDVLMSPIMIIPGRTIQFRCGNGHTVKKRDTLLI